MTRSLRQAALVATVASAAAVAWADLRLRPRPPVAPPVEPGRHAVRVVETRRVVPGPGIPSELSLGASNNNLDAVRHTDGFTYLAFRTAPHHFASPHTAIAVVRSHDETTWDFEARFALGTDLREPRLLSLGDRLFLYVSRLGRDAYAFEPQGIAMAERGGDGTWSELLPMGPPGVMGWRVRKLDGVPVFLVYSGGETIYDLATPRLRVELWRSDDGTLYGVIRNEAGDATGWGSKVCSASPGALANWSCRSDRRNYDSPCMFWHDGEAYLVARRNLCGSGEYDLGVGPGRLARTLWNQVNYSLTPKRTALWRYVRGEDRFAYLLDLPSRGDCCFPAVIDGARPDERVVYDYSCDIDGPDVAWLSGQRGHTSVYRHVLRFESRAS